MSNEEGIVNTIRAGLERDERIPHPKEVAIVARSGTVTLRGSVGSPGQRRAAVEVAKSVTGVKAVSDELRVDMLDRWLDDEIRGVALQELAQRVGGPAEFLDVRVADGWLTLKGEVKHQYDSDAAFDAVARVEGVGGITNEIRVIAAPVDG